MRCIERTIMTLTLVGVLIPGLGRVGQSRERPAGADSGTGHLIWGTVGVPGVTLQGLPGAPVSDETGRYRARVAPGWSGTVTPTRQGYRFEPPMKQYSAVQKDWLNENYVPSILTYTITGSLGVPGVAMKGLLENMVTDREGRYAVTVEYGWAGMVTPTKLGYRFDPPTREYSSVQADLANEDYTASVLTFTISGNVGVPEVVMEGLPGDPVTDSQGKYQATVEYGWSGAVTPTKEGYRFAPDRRTYKPVSGVEQGDYAPHVRTFNIYGQVWTPTISGTTGLAGVTLLGLPGEPITDKEGRYAVTVEYGWSGKVTPSKEGYSFEPAFVDYSKVIVNQRDQNFIATTRMAAVPDSAGEVLVIPTTAVAPEQFAQTAEDMRVMLNILREKLSEPRMIMGALVDYGDFFSGGRGTEALYLQGYGAIFVMRVDFPFSPAAGPKDQNEPGQKEPADPVWQKAREKLYAPANVTRYGGLRASGGPQGMSFEQFRDELLRTLKHAANIRNIEPNEWVILTVVGQGQEPAEAGRAAGRGSYSMGGGWVEGGSYSTSGSSFGMGGGTSYADSRTYSRGAGLSPGRVDRMRTGAAPAPTTFLTIQAKKFEVDAFAKGTLSFERFQQRVKMFTY